MRQALAVVMDRFECEVCDAGSAHHDVLAVVDMTVDRQL